ncbi:LysR family transcriptional regulator [Photobacterium profundum]|uniref:Transcriptional regulator, LysR family protein n=1 Tax=Photobacterium profundum 3TCK TaxID=314280 RepID=Q1Z9L0_9GAMM|nr:LysR family transcriptional regulator [Photobacterium profundum]EAS45832.1 Putative transcriptional regulator, LysR family protein [Photobacterium profundum 3TCK]PSV63044.1 LysR family transcriptional regulator [Photobacterium profundum]
MNINHIDLNLLRLMLLLLEEGSVSSVATRLNLTQSAVSKQLTRLREQLGGELNDPLFVRTGRGLEPTAQAVKLEQPLRHWLQSSQKMFVPDTFIPAEDKREFQISICETSFSVVVPLLLPKLHRLAPGMKINIVSKSADSLQRLREGQLDLLVIAKDTDQRAQISSQVTELKRQSNHELYQDHHVCLLRSEHPILEKKWGNAAFLQVPQIRVLVEENKFWLLDQVVAESGHCLDSKTIVPDFNSAALLVQHTDMMLVCTSIFARKLAKSYSLQQLPLPFNLKPVSYRMLWPETLEHDAAHLWLRGIISGCCQELQSNNVR